MIPYGIKNTYKVILLHNGFAQLADFNWLSEEYIFKCHFIAHPETFLMGNDARILIRPFLTVNENECDLNLLWNTRVEVFTISYIDNIPVKKSFDNIKLDSGEIEVNF